MRTILFALIAFFFASCGCGGQNRNGLLRVGVDVSWAPLDFDEMQPYVNGYTEDVLREISRYSGMEFVKINASWDNLLEGLQRGTYDAVLSSLPPYPYNQAKYDFSQDYLELGPVLVTASNANYTDLQHLSGELVGVISGDPAVLVVQKYPDVIVRNYNSYPEALSAVADGEIEGAVLDRLPATSYVRDLYAGKLKIASAPLTGLGLHLVAPKGKAVYLIRTFDKGLAQMKKKKKLNSLLSKWRLD
jgi:ABC-type amino acid transport substrate-binding protein